MMVRLRDGAGLRLIGLVVAASTAVVIGIVAVPVASATEPAAPGSSALLKPARPYWIELTAPQREALAPLANDWERLDAQTKKKWVTISSRYPSMSHDEQQHAQQRMREWASLTPDQRRIARDSFARVRDMNREQRAELLRRYSELPEEKKHALATEGRANKAIVVPKPASASTTPATARSIRRAQINEGARVANPAVVARKAAEQNALPPPAPTALPTSAPAP